MIYLKIRSHIQVGQKYSVLHGTGGFTLIEVLVAMLIMSFGLLGVASLVVTSLRYHQTAGQRAVATQLAVDMADRMRANTWSVIGANGARLTTYMTSTVNFTASRPTCTSCSSADIAAQDFFDWSDAVKSTLPGGQGLVRWSPVGNANQIQVVLAWNEAGKQDKSWDASVLEASLISTNQCPANGTGGLTINSSTRCFVFVFYP